jgi:hypothetical protein
MKKHRRPLQLHTETVRALTGPQLARVAGGGIYTEPVTTSSNSKARTHCAYETDCIEPHQK